MLISHTTTHCHKRVLIQVGSHIIDQVTNCITEEELQTLSQSWKLAYVSTIISKLSRVSDQEFDLEQVKGKAVISKEVKIPAFQTMITEGLPKVMRHQKHVHVLVEPSPKCMSVFFPGNTIYEVVEQPLSKLLVFKIQSTEGDDTKVVHRNLLLPLFSGPLDQTSEQDSKSLVEQTVGTQQIFVASAVISHVHYLGTYGRTWVSNIFQKGLEFVTALFK